MVTTTVMMTQNVAAAGAEISATPPSSEHLAANISNNSAQYMANSTPCGSSNNVAVFSPTKLREEEKKIQTVSSNDFLN